MKYHLYRASCLLLITFGLVGCASEPTHVLASVQKDADRPQEPAQSVSKHTRSAAVAVLDALDDAQRKKIARPIKDPLRKDWHFVPRQREGVMLGELDAGQKALVHKLMQTALSDSGYLKATDIIWLETVLYEMSNQNPGRDPGKYALLIFGDPADEQAAWGWRLEGHHLSINLTYTPEGIGVTPMFFGTNPAVVQQGPLAGKRVLHDAHHVAVKFAASMNDEQRKKMMLEGKPRDVITGPGREKAFKADVGIAFGEMDLEQQFAFIAFVSMRIQNLENEHARSVIRKVTDFGGNASMLEGFRFAWAGPIDADKPFYYRIQSPTFVFEYSCQGKNHVHAVMHDLTDPLHEDLLKKHFEQHEH